MTRATQDAPFDRIVVLEGTTPVEYSLERFLRLPLTERVRKLLAGQVTFSLGGAVVENKVALDALRELAARGGVR